jgi:hypothetical protein
MRKLSERSPGPESKIVKRKKRAPGATLESRENQLINLTIALAEKQIRDGTASSQVMTHFLKLGSTKERLEKEKISNENLLLQAKVLSITSQKTAEEMTAKAMIAMGIYRGEETERPDD